MNTSSPTFLIALMQELMCSMTNWYGSENCDSDRFGPYKKSFKSEMASKLNELYADRMAILPVKRSHELIQNVSKIENSIEGLARIYDLLADEPSRSILVKVWAYRILGHRKVKLPLNTEAYWLQRESLRSLIKSQNTMKVKFFDWELNHLALDKIGYPIELFYLPGSIMFAYILKQYEYGKRTPKIKARAGNYIIDGGACWGDTALYFAHEVGESGKVYSFEFTPDNLELFNRNVGLNPRLSDRIELIPKALWNKSNEVITYTAYGPATSVAANQQNGSLQVSTIAIDDLVREKKLPRVDYIKMDIEGAELNSLKGAEETLRTFKPRLAISVYHRDNDFIEIPAYLDGLGLGYEFFLDHFTIYGEETVLFATPKTD